MSLRQPLKPRPRRKRVVGGLDLGGESCMSCMYVAVLFYYAQVNILVVASSFLCGSLTAWYQKNNSQ